MFESRVFNNWVQWNSVPWNALWSYFKCRNMWSIENPSLSKCFLSSLCSFSSVLPSSILSGLDEKLVSQLHFLISYSFLNAGGVTKGIWQKLLQLTSPVLEMSTFELFKCASVCTHSFPTSFWSQAKISHGVASCDYYYYRCGFRFSECGRSCCAKWSVQPQLRGHSWLRTGWQSSAIWLCSECRGMYELTDIAFVNMCSVRQKTGLTIVAVTLKCSRVLVIIMALN